MITEPSTSILPASQIRKFIEQEYNVSSYNVNIYNKEKIDITIVSKTESSGYEVSTPIRFEKDDIFDIVDKILTKEGVSFEIDRFYPIVDLASATDRSDSEFIGIRFTWKKNKEN